MRRRGRRWGGRLASGGKTMRPVCAPLTVTAVALVAVAVAGKIAPVAA